MVPPPRTPPFTTANATIDEEEPNPLYDRMLELVEQATCKRVIIYDLARAVDQELVKHAALAERVRPPKINRRWEVSGYKGWLLNTIQAVAAEEAQFDWSPLIACGEKLLDPEEATTDDDTIAATDTTVQPLNLSRAGSLRGTMPPEPTNIGPAAQFNQTLGTQVHVTEYQRQSTMQPVGVDVRLAGQAQTSAHNQPPHNVRPLDRSVDASFANSSIQSVIPADNRTAHGQGAQQSPTDPMIDQQLAAMMAENARLRNMLTITGGDRFATERCMILNQDQVSFDGTDTAKFEVWQASIEAKVRAGHLTGSEGILLIKQSLGGDALRKFLRRDYTDDYAGAMAMLRRHYEDPIGKELAKNEFDTITWNGKDKPSQYLTYLIDICPMHYTADEKCRRICQNLATWLPKGSKERRWAVRCSAEHKTLSWLEERFFSNERIDRYGEQECFNPQAGHSQAGKDKKPDKATADQDKRYCTICKSEGDHINTNCPIALANDANRALDSATQKVKATTSKKSKKKKGKGADGDSVNALRPSQPAQQQRPGGQQQQGAQTQQQQQNSGQMGQPPQFYPPTPESLPLWEGYMQTLLSNAAAARAPYQRQQSASGQQQARSSQGPPAGNIQSLNKPPVDWSTYKCHACGNYGHIAKNCPVKLPQPQAPEPAQACKMVRQFKPLEKNTRYVDLAFLDDEDFDDDDPSIWVGGHGVPREQYLPDTGSEVNLLSTKWVADHNITLRPTLKKLRAVNNSKIDLAGVVQLPVKTHVAECVGKFYVAEKLDNEVLIGTETLSDLGIRLTDGHQRDYMRKSGTKSVGLVAAVRRTYSLVDDDEEMLCVWPSHGERTIKCASIPLTPEFSRRRARLYNESRCVRKTYRLEPSNDDSDYESDCSDTHNKDNQKQQQQTDECPKPAESTSEPQTPLQVDEKLQTTEVGRKVVPGGKVLSASADSQQPPALKKTELAGNQTIQQATELADDKQRIPTSAGPQPLTIHSVSQSLPAKPAEDRLPTINEDDDHQPQQKPAATKLGRKVNGVQQQQQQQAEQHAVPKVPVDTDETAEPQQPAPDFVQFDGRQLHGDADYGPELCDTWLEATEAVDWREAMTQTDDKAKFASELDFADGLTADQKSCLIDVLWSVRHAFSSAHVATATQDVDDIGVTEVEHPINTNGPPFKVKARRIPLGQLADVEKMVQELLDGGYIRRSKSPYSSCIVLVRKKDGSWRLCVDYRQLNAITIPDRTPLPRIDALLDTAAGHEWLSALDIKSAYYNIRVREEDIEKTAFTVGDRLFEFTRMPFGLCTAAQTFTRAITQALDGVASGNCLTYLDDVIIFSHTFADHLQHVHDVCAALQKFGLKLNVSKSSFAQHRLLYLGHWVSADGIEADEGKVKAITEYPRPETKKQMRRFLGLAKYLGRYYRNLAVMLKPLNEMTCKGLRLQGPLEWNELNNSVFNAVRVALATPPVLKPPSPGSTYYIVTDASTYGYGGILMQEHEKQLCPVYYASKSATSAEQNYAPVEQEARAVVYCLEKWRAYVLLEDIQVLTDHRPLISLFLKYNTDKITPRLYRWLLIVQQYKITIRYLPGVANEGADALSRIHEPPDGKRWQKVRAVAVIDDEVEGREAIAERFHCGKAGGHFGWRKVLARVKSFYSTNDWPTMSADVKRVCQQCDICRMRSTRYTVPPLQPMPPPTRPGQTWHLDYSEIRSGTQYPAIAVAIDAFSRWIVAIPAKRQDATTALQLMTSVINHSGMPLRIITDSGRHFVCRQFQEQLAAWGVEHLVCTPYQKTANGLAERAIANMQDVIAKRREQLQLKEHRWNECLNDALIAYNACPHVSLGLRSPYEVERGVPYALRGTDCAPTAPLDDYWLKVRTDIEKCQRAAADRSRKSRSTNYKFYEGDKVWLQHLHGMHQRKRKIDMPNRLKGVILHFNHRSAVVQMPDGKTRVVPLSMMQPRFAD